ncbi:unnamed protein product [Aureobasidium uvarum]|uniref:Uncharacterized protein n=1 Tax=Aureobasidium uvarum TaxID=2773716 RepID=A0A9N8KLR9_9PEZI|nr:unnamed protein product [Aureobasidium uvarum]
MNYNTPQLPVEIVDHIIRSTIPDTNHLAYPASDLTTKTLLAYLTVSKAASQTARSLLYIHCLYIDTPWRLDLLLRRSSLRASVSTIQRLYLSPFPGRTIRVRKVVNQIAELFTILSSNLKRLVVDMPLRSHYPEEDVTDQLRPILRKGFEQLVHLEEFCSIRDELYLACHVRALSPEVQAEFINGFVFQKWTKLRRLALYNQMLDSEFRTALANMPNLDTVVLSRPDYDYDFRLNEVIARFEDHVKVVIVDATDDAAQAGMRKLSTDTDSPQDTLSNAWKLEFLIRKNQDSISAVQEWSLQRMLEGELWTLPEHCDFT